MAGRRLLDIAALFNASRGVAKTAATLQRQRFDAYTRTSSLAKAIKSQTDRVTETAKAASFLAARLNEQGPAWNTVKSEARDDADERIPSHESAAHVEGGAESKEGIAQDHHWKPSEKNTTTDPLPSQDLDIRQEQAARYPLPDGTIPPKDSKIGIPKHDRDVVSERPIESIQEPLADEDKALEPVSSDSSTIPIPDTTKISAVQHGSLPAVKSKQDVPSSMAEIPDSSSSKLSEGHDQDVTYEPAVQTPAASPSLPRTEIPQQTQDAQGVDENVANDGINADTYSSPIASEESASVRDAVPDGVNTELFYSPRVAKMLGGETTHRYDKPFASSKKATRHPLDQRPIHEEEQSQMSANTTTDSQKTSSSESTMPDLNIRNVSPDASPYQMRESSVPSSRFGRLWSYGGLAAGMLGGAVSESLKRAVGAGSEGSFMLSAGNMDRLVTKLSRMRGAALKLGQMMSFQDSKMLPAPIQQVLLRVQDSADYMPAYQRDKVLSVNLGENWKELFSSFEEKPIAAASIGQVHSAVLKEGGNKVAVKIQYPGVASSIDSDLNNLSILLTASRLLPKGLFLDKTIANAKTELAWECDYVREAEAASRFEGLLADEKDTFVVPHIFPEASGKQVLTMEFMEGVGVTKVQTFTQEQKDWIGTQILRLCLREITEFRYMQTDPNWTNFLYNARTNKLELLDFGASREYPVEFITRYTRLLLAASKADATTVRELSIELGYLTGQESPAMLKAHIASVMTLAEPFVESSPEVYEFKDQTITERVKALIPVMIKERLSPPPEETYSLHRKLSGAFLLCAKLGSRVRCRELFVNSMKKAGLT